MTKLLSYANPVNRVMAQENNREYIPVVGSYMTLIGICNRTVWEVIYVNDAGDDVLVRECATRPVDNTLPNGHQTWSIRADTTGSVVRACLRKDGTFRQWRDLKRIFVPGQRYYYAWA
jgi:hypothetical protein